MALVSLVSVPALFIVGPLLGLDVVRACRNSRAAPGDLRILLATVAAPSAAVAVPLAVTVLPQPAGAQYSYFNFLSANPWEAFVEEHPVGTMHFSVRTPDALHLHLVARVLSKAGRVQDM